MATNKIALLRYQTIDKCLQNHYRKWALDDLIEAVSEALYDYEGITSGISKRTIQGDIQLMRSDKLGYHAPIIVTDRKYYSYADKNYSIQNSPVSSADMEKMKEVIGFLKQVNGFQYFDELNGVITRLENNLAKTKEKTRNYIQFEENPLLKGLAHLNRLYTAVANKQPLLINYQSFRQNEPRQTIYYPYLLKEYRNRWFLLVKPQKSKTLYTLALDRMVDFYELANEDFVDMPAIDFEHYFDNAIGVTKSLTEREQKVVFKVTKKLTPYVVTKPLHATQKLIEETELSALFSIDVILNFELERELIGFGEELEVLAPRSLRKRIQKRLSAAADQYMIQPKKTDM